MLIIQLFAHSYFFSLYIFPIQCMCLHTVTFHAKKETSSEKQFFICSSRRQSPLTYLYVYFLFFSCASILQFVFIQEHKSAAISVRILRLPSPGILAHFLQIALCHPAKLFFCLCCIRVTGRDISCPSSLNHIGQLFSTCF